MTKEISTKYDPSEIEGKWYEYWTKQGLFHSEPDEREPYTIVIPPPNVTGVLHMGHMLNNTIQDILIRRARMMGKNACWVPGTDHASIATEAKVVAKLASEGVNKNDITREQFIEHAWEWTRKHGGIILEQLKKLGASCDWERTCFTMDEKRSESVIKVFADLYDKKLIYRGIRMVNWDPKAKTALSDEEVIHREEHGKLYYIRYKLSPETLFEEEGSPEWAVIATTRPETIFGDIAVCINPNNPKTAKFKGKKLIVPIVNREVPVIEDEYVDMEFGTGFLKVTPAHDINDYVIGEKFNLEVIDVFNDDGTLNAHGLQYEGMDRFDVKEKIESDLDKLGLLEKVESYTNKVGYSERTNVAVEPKLSMQWFLKMDELAKPAIEAVADDTIKFYPPKFKNMYRHWMENIKDWCISRQLWWGHRIPAYYLPSGGYVVAETAEKALIKARELSGNSELQIADLRQDEDCLDTWFSSWLWPISVFDGINQPDNKDINYYYPSNDLVTAPEIIFFWVARMIISGYEYRQAPCFRNVYFTGIVRDKIGRKMSKSLGNSPDPIHLIEKYGADGVRMGMLLTSPAGNDLPFDEALCEQGRNFNNKIWNSFRLIKNLSPSNLSPTPPTPQRRETVPESSEIAVKWFASVLGKTIAEVGDLFDKYRLSEALMLVYKLFWDEFSSWFLEIIKPAYQQDIDSVTIAKTKEYFGTLLKLLHPFMPFITEEVWQRLEYNVENPDDVTESIMIAKIPKPENIDENLIASFNTVKEIVANVRTVRLQKNIPNKESIVLEVIGEHDNGFDPVIRKMGNVSEIRNVVEKSAVSVSFLVGTTEYSVPVEGNIDVEAELAKLNDELRYLEGFLASVNKKLLNEKFVANAKPEIVANERKKLSDTESKINTLREQIARLK
ncbi:MAG: valine--tRNA ligase [Prevotellaceae bacterium]|jgi:valyl-tRNA synthetase|nr:valine--tRNA ligase [Prevotellaceae bacterium]